MTLPPDFELYGNVGRSTDQIHAHNTNTPTVNDLYRWAAHDAREFTDSLGLGDAGQSISAWTDQIHRARTAAEFHSVTEAVLGDGRSGLGGLYDFLDMAAAWCGEHQEPDLADRYRKQPSTCPNSATSSPTSARTTLLRPTDGGPQRPVPALRVTHSRRPRRRLPGPGHGEADRARRPVRVRTLVGLPRPREMDGG